MLTIYGRKSSFNLQKVMWLVNELGIAHRHIEMGGAFGGLDTPEFRALNPHSRVPVIVDGDVTVWESHTILRYLAALHAPKLTGATPAECTQVERWMDWLLGALNTPYVAVFKDAKKPAAERAGDFAAQSADLVAQLKILDGHITGKSWFALDRFTLADVALGPIVKRCLEFPIEKPAFPELSRWMRAVEARPAFAVATGAKPSTLAAA